MNVKDKSEIDLPLLNSNYNILLTNVWDGPYFLSSAADNQTTPSRRLLLPHLKVWRQ